MKEASLCTYKHSSICMASFLGDCLSKTLLNKSSPPVPVPNAGAPRGQPPKSGNLCGNKHSSNSFQAIKSFKYKDPEHIWHTSCAQETYMNKPLHTSASTMQQSILMRMIKMATCSNMYPSPSLHYPSSRWLCTLCMHYLKEFSNMNCP